jgi:hypothetical protein
MILIHWWYVLYGKCLDHRYWIVLDHDDVNSRQAFRDVADDEIYNEDDETVIHSPTLTSYYAITSSILLSRIRASPSSGNINIFMCKRMVHMSAISNILLSHQLGLNQQPLLLLYNDEQLHG